MCVNGGEAGEDGRVKATLIHITATRVTSPVKNIQTKYCSGSVSNLLFSNFALRFEASSEKLLSATYFSGLKLSKRNLSNQQFIIDFIFALRMT